MRCPGGTAQIAIVLAITLAGCASSPDGVAGDAVTTASSATAASEVTTGSRSHTFPGGENVDYQLGGAYAVPDGVGIVVRDSTERPAPGVWSICYVNGFQTQPGQEDRWSGERADLILRDGAGRVVVDPDWPDERLLDTRRPEKRRAIAAVIGEDLRRCAERGFDAVEIDNLDSFTRAPGTRLTVNDNMALAVLYARQAHHFGLLIAQKNAAEYSHRLRWAVGFDFAVAEECVSYAECRSYTDVYGDAVIDVEYSDDPRVSLRDICADPSRSASTVMRDRDLVPRGHRGYVYRRC
jgi:hypothetical protein